MHLSFNSNDEISFAIYIYTYTYIHIYIYIYTHTHTHIYIYIYMRNQLYLRNMLHVHHYDIESQSSLIDQNWLEFKFLKITGNRINNFKFKSVNLLVGTHLHGQVTPSPAVGHAFLWQREGSGENGILGAGTLTATANNILVLKLGDGCRTCT